MGNDGKRVKNIYFAAVVNLGDVLAGEYTVFYYGSDRQKNLLGRLNFLTNSYSKTQQKKCGPFSTFSLIAVTTSVEFITVGLVSLWLLCSKCHI
jgi:hypothetical protein